VQQLLIAKPDVDIDILYLPRLHLTAPWGGSRRNIAMPFGVEKLEWLGYPNEKYLKICLFVLT